MDSRYHAAKGMKKSPRPKSGDEMRERMTLERAMGGAAGRDQADASEGARKASGRSATAPSSAPKSSKRPQKNPYR